MVEEGWSARTRPGRRPRGVLAEVDARSKSCPSHWRKGGCLSEGGGGTWDELAGQAAPGPERPESERRNAGGFVVCLCFVCLVYWYSCLPACLPACPACPACCARPRATQCPLPVPSHAVWPGGRRQFWRWSMWADTDVDAGVAADVNEGARLVISKSCTQPARAGCVCLAIVGRLRAAE